MFRCLGICVMKKMDKKHTGGEESQGLSPRGWRAPVKSQTSAEAAKAKVPPSLRLASQRDGEGFFQIRDGSINLRR